MKADDISHTDTLPLHERHSGTKLENTSLSTDVFQGSSMRIIICFVLGCSNLNDIVPGSEAAGTELWRNYRSGLLLSQTLQGCAFAVG